MDNTLFLGTITLSVSALLLIGIVYLYRVSRGALATRADVKKEEALKAQVREKVQAAEINHDEETENLTNSGIFSVLEMMDALMSGGNLEEAEKWAFNAIHNYPNRVDVPIKLAEIYHQAGRKSAYIAIVNNLERKGLDVPQDAWNRLMAKGREIAPSEPLFH